MIRILLVDDQQLVQQGIKSLLEKDPSFKVVGTVTDGESALKQISSLRPDIVLLDIEMPGMNGISVTKYISHFLPEVKVIILSSHEEKKYLVQALVAGARSYILKNSLMKDLKQAIFAVDNGYSQIESRLLAKVLNSGTVKLAPIRTEVLQTQDTSKNQKTSDKTTKVSKLLDKVQEKRKQNSEIQDTKVVKLTDKISTSTSVEIDSASVNQDNGNEATPDKEQSSEILSEQNSRSKIYHSEQQNDFEQVESSASVISSDSTNLKSEVEPESKNIESSELNTETRIESEKPSISRKSDSEPELESKTLEASENLSEIPQEEAIKIPPLYDSSSDEPSYQTQINNSKVSGFKASPTKDNTSLVPVNLSSSELNNKVVAPCGASTMNSRTENTVLGKYFYKLNYRSDIQKIKLQIRKYFELFASKCNSYFEQYLKPTLLKYKPVFRQYKSRLMTILNQRSTQKILWNLGLMILGVMLILLIYAL